MRSCSGFLLGCVLAVAAVAEEGLVRKESVSLKIVGVRGQQVEVSAMNNGESDVVKLTVQCFAQKTVKFDATLSGLERAAGEAELPETLARGKSATLRVDLNSKGFKPRDIRCLAYAVP